MTSRHISDDKLLFILAAALEKDPPITRKAYDLLTESFVTHAHTHTQQKKGKYSQTNKNGVAELIDLAAQRSSDLIYRVWIRQKLTLCITMQQGVAWHFILLLLLRRRGFTSSDETANTCGSIFIKAPVISVCFARKSFTE